MLRVQTPKDNSHFLFVLSTTSLELSGHFCHSLHDVASPRISPGPGPRRVSRYVIGPDVPWR